MGDEMAGENMWIQIINIAKKKRYYISVIEKMRGGGKIKKSIEYLLIYTEYDSKLHLVVSLQFWRMWCHSFLGIIPRFTLTHSIVLLGQINLFANYLY